ncbi:MAG: DUF2235 domain-containing protein [Pseudomonadota bacterium]
MFRNLVICCDGTGNEIEENSSNVLKLYRVLEKNENQIAFYDPGVGTISDSGNWSRMRAKLRGVFGLATGAGLDANVLDAYRFLIHNYRDGDKIYLFGYSRGAYTARVLAGFLYLVGLMRPDQEHLAEYAFTAYKQGGFTLAKFRKFRGRENLATAERFRKVLQTRYVIVQFLGCWDTVSSVLAPRADRFMIPSLLVLPYTQTNRCVRVFRHAMAIDERRRMFRINKWKNSQPFTANRDDDRDAAPRQDIKQVWFAGVHGDVGGGYPETQSGAAKYPLGWMIDEAMEHGLKTDPDSVAHLVYGRSPDKGKADAEKTKAPNPNAMLHDSMNFGWKVLELFPRIKRTRGQWLPSIRMSRPVPRKIPANATIHPSVWERTTYSGPGDPYRPVNLPDRPEPPET